MKIELFITDLSSGGAEHQIAILASFLAERGYDVTLSTYSDCVDHYPVHSQVKRMRIGEGKGKIAKIMSIYNHFFKTRSECVISFGHRSNFLMLVPCLVSLRKRKLIVSERCAIYTKLKYFQRINYHILYRYTDFIVSNSHSQCKDIVNRYQYLTDKTVTITNYTDTGVYNFWKKSNSNCQNFKIGTLCRYSPEKNYDHFAHAIKKLTSITDREFEIHWYGSTVMNGEPNKYYIEFCDIIENLGLQKTIILHPSTNKVNEIIPTFDAMCQPSLVEGFSNSISEYICCGKPVVASDVADNSIMVHDGENGYLFDPTNEESIVDAFIKLLNLSDEQLTNMGFRSRRIAEELFDKEKFVNSYIKLIES